MSMAFVATITSRWFVARRGLVSGILTAGNATGQLIFLPVVAWLATHHGWRTAALLAAAAALAVVPLVLLLLRNHPADLGLQAFGATEADPGPPPHQHVGSTAGRALTVLRDAGRSRTFWLLSGGFAICGMIDGYNSGTPTQLRYIMRVIAMRIMLKGFIYTDYLPRNGEFYGEMGPWVASGAVKGRDTIVEGLEKTPDAFLGLFSGANTGKMLVKLS